MASVICQTLGRGVTRSKRRAQQYLRQAAENGYAMAHLELAHSMYMDLPYSREVGHVGRAAGVTLSAGVMEGHDVPPDILTGVVHWLLKGCATGELLEHLNSFRREALVGAQYCRNEGCEVVGPLKDFKVCPQCKMARYCGAACQNEDWTTGGHKASCGSVAFEKVDPATSA
jgi:hypothetical protein